MVMLVVMMLAMVLMVMVRVLRMLDANIESGMFRGAGLRHVRTAMIFRPTGMMIIISGKRCSSLNTGVARAYEASDHHHPPTVTFTTRAPGNIPPCPSPQPRDRHRHHHQYHRHQHRQQQHPALMPYGIPHQPSKAVPTLPPDPTPTIGRKRPPRPFGICTTRTRNAARAYSTTRSMQSVP